MPGYWYRKPTPPLEALVYSRRGCHLCDEACAVLVRHGLTPRVIDIDTDPELQARYHETIPVVYIDGRQRFCGRIDERLLARLLRGRARI